MSFRDQVDADRRLIILRVLAENGGCANESVLERALIMLGEKVGLDRAAVRGHIRFLETADCLVVDLYRDQVMVPTITKRGVAVVEGRITVDGVARPSMGV